MRSFARAVETWLIGVAVTDGLCLCLAAQVGSSTWLAFCAVHGALSLVGAVNLHTAFREP